MRKLVTYALIMAFAIGLVIGGKVMIERFQSFMESAMQNRGIEYIVPDGNADDREVAV